MTFAEDGVADRVSRRTHEICGHQVLLHQQILEVSNSSLVSFFYIEAWFFLFVRG